MKKTDYRSCNGLEFRAVDDEGEKMIVGHAAVFNRQTNVGGFFYEVIKSGAFDSADLRDVPLMVNHDFSKIPLARSRRNNGNSTLAFIVDGEEWQDLNSETPTRRIKSIGKVFEVSACTYPQYETDLHARSEIAPDGAKKVLENARAQSLDKKKELEILKLKNRLKN